MAGLLDFLQGASNAAANNVSGPVDAFSWLLRKAGMGNVIGEAPVGGSDWMRQKGLTAEAPGLMGLLGEAAGMSLPIAAVAKAPQIAAGLNQMAANAAVRPTLNPQTGAIVWHGSPHKFDKFDASKIGTGEGAQAYGHGLYLADNPGVATGYADKLSQVSSDGGFTKMPRFATYGARRVDMNAPSSSLTPGELALTYANMDGGRANGLLALREMASDPYVKDAERYKKAADILMRMNPKKIGADAGNLYKVYLPDEHIARMLDWDLPLSQQAPEVRSALRKIIESEELNIGKNATRFGPLNKEAIGNHFEQLTKAAGGQHLLSQELQMQGIPGIRYLDKGSRTAGTGTRNYVVFPGEEGLLKILERNGQALK
jgi:hypothetical protein